MKVIPSIFLAAFAALFALAAQAQSYNPKEICTRQIEQERINEWTSGVQGVQPQLARYYCHQVIADMSKDGEAKVSYLQDQGFTLRETCPCNPDLQLWESPQQITTLISDQRTRSRGGVNGDTVSLNYVLDMVPPTLQASTNLYNTNPPNFTASNQKVVVAILDTGVDTSNTTLQPFLWHNPDPDAACAAGGKYGYEFSSTPGPHPYDRNGHGTFVNGVVAGVPNPSIPNANVSIKLMNVKITDGATGEGSLYNAVCGIYYAVKNGANVINLSWGFYEPEIHPVVMAEALEFAKSRNVLLVTSAGNDHVNTTERINWHWPSGYADEDRFPGKPVVTVAGYSNPTTISVNHSNYGPKTVTLAAPGEQVASTTFQNGFVLMNGTSAAAPFVARAAALAYANNTSLKPADFKSCFGTKPTGSSNTLLLLNTADQSKVRSGSSLKVVSNWSFCW